MKERKEKRKNREEEGKKKKKNEMEEKKEGKSRFPGTEMERVEVNPQSGSLPRDCPEKRQKLRTEGNSVTLLRITSLP